MKENCPSFSMIPKFRGVVFAYLKVNQNFETRDATLMLEIFLKRK